MFSLFSVIFCPAAISHEGNLSVISEHHDMKPKVMIIADKSGKDIINISHNKTSVKSPRNDGTLFFFALVIKLEI